MRNPRFWIGLALSVVCLYFAFRGIDFTQLAVALTQANYWVLVPALAVIGLTQVGRTYRWRDLFYPDSPPPVGKLFSALSIGYLVSTILPARLGDFVRAVLIGGQQGQRVSKTLMTIVVERALDVFSIIVLLLLLIPFMGLPEWLMRPALSIVAVFFLLSVGLWLAAWQRERALRLTRALLNRLPAVPLGRRTLRLDPERWTERAGGFLDGLAILSHLGELSRVGLWSMIIWGLGGVLFNYLSMRAFGLHNAVDGNALAAAAFVQVVLALGATVPSSPGYVGVYHAGVILALSVFGVPQADALAFALVSHAANFGLLIIIGAACLWREGLSLAELTSRKAEPVQRTS